MALTSHASARCGLEVTAVAPNARSEVGASGNPKPATDEQLETGHHE